eukprot:364595-Chlamydomonas_euryale.AAC.9
MAQCMERDRERLGFKTTRMTCRDHTFCGVASMWYCNMQATTYRACARQRSSRQACAGGMLRDAGHAHAAPPQGA